MKLENYELYKLKELYSTVLYDTGKSPEEFHKSKTVIDPDKVQGYLNADIKINTRNLRIMSTGPLALVKKTAKELNEMSPSPDRT